MRSARFGFFFFLLFFNLLVGAQQIAPQQTQPTTTKDPPAISVINQVLNAAGGSQAISAISSYIATGTINYLTNGETNAQGNVTVRALGLNLFRIDTTAPWGARSEVTNVRTSVKDANGVVTTLRTQPSLAAARFILPYLHLRVAVGSNTLNVVYKGLVTVDGNSSHDIQIQQILPPGPDGKMSIMDSVSVDYFIDQSSFRVVMMQDTLPRYGSHQVRYSNFTPVNGVLVPFSITENLHGQNTRLIQLNQITFNSDSQTSDFVFQAQ
jgi:hypothetical protein